MNCPCCNVPLSKCAGTQMDPNDGVTVYCANRKCPAEISGHGDTVKEAEKIVSQRKLKSESNE
jgi:hypothetical protein